MKLFFLAFMIIINTPHYLFSQYFSRDIQEPLSLMIEQADSLLTLTLTNNGPQDFQVPLFPSVLNYVRVVNPIGATYAINPTHCDAKGSFEDMFLKKGESRTFTYDVDKRIFNTPYRALSIFTSYPGEYVFTWVVLRKYEVEVKIEYR